jgi:tRNA modification GTPase
VKADRGNPTSGDVVIGDNAIGNLAICLTPAGVAALAVVRLCGPGVDGFLARHFNGKPAVGRCVFGRICADDGGVIDQVIVVRLPDDDSYGAGADIGLHGGRYIVQSFLKLAERAGFEVVADGFAAASAKASLAAADGDSIIEREVAAHFSLAATELAAELLCAQAANWPLLQRAVPDLETLRRILRDRALWRLLHPPRVAIVGVPNVGKSTLANALFGRERALTADLPGTTRDWVGGIADLDGLAVQLIDTPGLRETGQSVEAEAIRRAGRVARRARVRILVLDPTQERGQQMELLGTQKPSLIVANKSDCPARWPPPAEAILTAATIGRGVDELRWRIREVLACGDLSPAVPRWWTRRQRHWLIEQIRMREYVD